MIPMIAMITPTKAKFNDTLKMLSATLPLASALGPLIAPEIPDSIP